MTSPSSFVTVNGVPISMVGTSGANVAAGSTVTVALVSSTGVSSWSLSCTQSDDMTSTTSVNNTITAPSLYVREFVAPDMDGYRGAAMIFTSTVNAGKPNQNSSTFGIWVPNINVMGTRLFAGGESLESNATVGNAADLNAMMLAIAINGSAAGPAGGDLSGSYPNPTVATASGHIIITNATSAGGDLAGGYPNPTVVGLQGHPVLAQSLSSSQDGYALTWHNASSTWKALPEGGGFLADGDLSGSASTQEVVGIRSIAVPAPSGTATVLTYNAGAYTWGAGGSGITTLTGDVSASGSGSVTATVNSISGGSPIVIQQGEFIWSAPAIPILTQTDNIFGSGEPFTIIAQKSLQSGNHNGGNIVLQPGLGHGSGSNGGVQISASNFTVSGIAHNDSSGNLFSALITDADVSASASITISKLAAGTSAQVMMNSSTPTPTWTTISGDVVLASTGATTVAALQGNAVKSQSLGSAQDGYALTWHNATSQWEALPESGGGGGSFTAGGDLSGTSSSQQVVSITGGSGVVDIAATGNIITWVAATTAPGITQATPASDVATVNMTISAQSAFASASTHKSGAALVLEGGTPASGGSPGGVYVNSTVLAFGNTLATPVFGQLETTTAATSLTIQAQQTSGSFAGGVLNLSSGPGGTASGALNLQVGNSSIITISGAGVVAIPAMSTAGILHNAVTTGVLSSSLIVNADVSSSAAVAVSKLAAGTSAQVLLNSAAPTPTWTTLSGDVTVSNAGATNVAAIQGVVISGTPSASQVLTATSTTAAHWAAAGGGSATPTVVTKTSSYAVAGSNYVVLCNSSGAITITAPSPATSGTFFIVKDITGNATTNPITIAPNASEHFDGVAASVIYVTNYGSIEFCSDGTNWWSI